MALQSKPAAGKENADGASPADRVENELGRELQAEDPALRLEDVQKVRDSRWLCA
jgi:hypothetical protein